MRSITAVLTALVLAAAGAGCSRKPATPGVAEALTIVPDIQTRVAQFAPMTLAADVSVLDEGDHTALSHLVAAARVVDDIFLRQVWTGNPEFAERVATLNRPDGRAARDYFRIMFGPWDRLADFQPFIGGMPHPKGAGFYPEDMTKEEFESWLGAHPDDRAAFTSTVAVIRRKMDRLVAVPYSEEYRDLLQKAGDELRAAAAATGNASLKRFCELRAAAFSSNAYTESDMAWMGLDGPIEVAIGPYETYEDSLFGYKASFESFVCIVNPGDSRNLAAFKGELPYLESNLPIRDEYKNPNRGTESPISVADEVFTAGEAKAGVQTLAFNLPNDEQVREAKGSKKVLLKNMMRAKYNAILTPIATRVLPEAERREVDFDAYFQFILSHELAHGLGPGHIVKDSRPTEVRLELKELYPAIEEAKADVLGVYDLYALGDKGIVPKAVIDRLPSTYVAGLFRSARFGTSDAHGRGVVAQTAYLLNAGAIETTTDGHFRPVSERFRAAVGDLAQNLLMIEALGSYPDAEAFLEQFGAVVPPAMQRKLDGFGGIPVDIAPVFAYGN
jgi:hypothetical protein